MCLRGGAHESYMDHEFHWTIRYDKEGLEADHIKCPLWGVLEHRRGKFITTYLAGFADQWCSDEFL